MNQGPGYQLLVFVAQLAVFGALGTWWLRCTRPGREVCKAAVWVYRAPARRRDARARLAWGNWMVQVEYWAGIKRAHRPGTRQYELAQDAINALQRVRPPNPYPCPHTAFTCATPGCSNHSRSTS